MMLSALLLAGLGLITHITGWAAEAPLSAISSATTAEGIALKPVLDSVAAIEIAADVHFLASDALEGRDTPGRGLRVAARFLRARLQRLGWEPGAGAGYLQTYKLEHRAVDASRSSFVLELGDGENLSLQFGEDYIFSNGEVWDHTVRAEVVGAGRGEREDLSGLDVAGKWALCLDSGRHAGLRRRLLMKAGARGVIVLPNPGLRDQTRFEKLARSAGWALRGTVSYPREQDRIRPTTDYFHQIYLTSKGFTRMGDLLGESSAEELTRPGREHEFKANDLRRLPGESGLIEVENVCGFWPGKDPVLSREVILLSAHYDHDGIKAGNIYNGADDNASGTSGLLAIAEALTEYGPMKRSVMLIWVSAEEKGLFGSQAWVESPTLPSGTRSICNINIDMIGRNAPGELYITPSKRHRNHNGLVELADRFAPLEGFPELGSADRYYDRSDHANFARLGIPVAFLFNGEHEDYHQPTDTFEKIDTDKIRRVVRLVLRILDALQAEDLDL